MVDQFTVLALASLTMLLASFVQGVTGFGHALLAIGFLSVLFGPHEAILVLTLLGPVIALAYFLRVRKMVIWSEVLALSVPLCLVGLPAGIWLFTWIDAEPLERVVGVVVMVSAFYFLYARPHRPSTPPRSITMGVGLCSGLLCGLTSTGGPPLVLYLHWVEMDKQERMAVLQAVFLISSLAKAIQVSAIGLLTTQIVFESAVLGVSVTIGVLLGAVLHDRMPAVLIRRTALALLLVIGIVLAL